MAITASIPKLVSTKILRTLENNLIAKKICTMEPDAPIKKVGDTVYFTGLDDPSIDDYTGTFTYEGMTDGQIALLIDQKKKYAFKVNDIEAFQSNIDIKGSQVDRAGYGLRNVCDQYLLGLYGDAGTINSAVTVTPSNVLGTVENMITALAEANVPKGQMWIVLPFWAESYLRLAGVKFSVNDGMEGEQGGVSYCDYAGCMLYLSNNITLDSTEYKCMGGSYNSIVYAEQIMKNRFIPELENDFAGGASGLHVYGAKVIKPAELVTQPMIKGSNGI